ncbi:uncharacterized protein ATNIH1004_002068 [Aspergillus tanneri]|uniref:Uncharacterized protein n=1 Tax=Aspergillus tanneri TaxID=1220188 RepID=A0A5M9ME43_9EURO|nr:uncharacterized protein ATNIH1004_002068 [Aspergillus tanneri]KAA8641267.1 hypothetical protein ATNIH1004_002068 [Aspergillus tanneri]
MSLVVDEESPAVLGLPGQRETASNSAQITRRCAGWLPRIDVPAFIETSNRSQIQSLVAEQGIHPAAVDDVASTSPCASPDASQQQRILPSQSIASTGKYREGESVCANVLARRQMTIGEDDLDTLETRRRLAEGTAVDEISKVSANCTIFSVPGHALTIWGLRILGASQMQASASITEPSERCDARSPAQRSIWVRTTRRLYEHRGAHGHDRCLGSNGI